MFLFYFGYKQQLRRPSEKSNCFRSCDLGLIPSPVNQRLKNWYSQLLYFTLSMKTRSSTGNDGDYDF